MSQGNLSPCSHTAHIFRFYWLVGSSFRGGIRRISPRSLSRFTFGPWVLAGLLMTSSFGNLGIIPCWLAPWHPSQHVSRMSIWSRFLPMVIVNFNLAHGGITTTAGGLDKWRLNLKLNPSCQDYFYKEFVLEPRFKQRRTRTAEWKDLSRI